ncbi:regulatory protein RecX, partial [Candidatus Gottesmanbacteria bacterium]|nr:regulatory protein RecX [Candidatus Gottesmanbacteria bacterium]
LKLLSFRPRTKKEITTRLHGLVLKKGITNKVLDKVILDLEEKNLINDREFVSWWITQRETFRPKGTRLLKIELRQKGIDSNIIEEVLEERQSGPNQFEQALALAQKRYTKISSLPTLKVKEKIVGLLGRRGFSYDIIYEVIDTLFKKD